MRRDRYSSALKVTVSRPPSPSKDSMARPRPAGSSSAEIFRCAISGMSMTLNLNLASTNSAWRDSITLLRGHHEHHVRMAGGVLVDRDVEHVDGGVVDVEIEYVLQAPAHGRFQFFGRHIGRVELQQLVFAAAEQDAAARAVHLARQAFQQFG